MLEKEEIKRLIRNGKDKAKISEILNNYFKSQKYPSKKITDTYAIAVDIFGDGIDN